MAAMKALLKDFVVALGVALLIVVLMLFSSFSSTFIYRGF
jgi:ABC-type lipoprotein release transport system permease subunit